MTECMILNLESGMPTVEIARMRLNQGLRSAKAAHTPVVKIIHGYGSSGKGGAIRTDTQRELLQKKQAGQLRAVVKGKDFSMFDADSRKIIEVCPQLVRDRDYGSQNHGITMVLL